jgi:hypothetical protein
VAGLINQAFPRIRFPGHQCWLQLFLIHDLALEIFSHFAFP